ncbi:expressed unknown protein [Seminavis robusta]|uniref:RING-type domain-containing protein n=1 Tax=Seminavis robusta TaxID=568900 RepID=A0A9N8EIH0_9STRA|nr:expressed unknown protein [Seminavis robusta]|eukprot:Sro1188_g250550.1 n/a (368) ;mRNA; f:3995-5098
MKSLRLIIVLSTLWSLPVEVTSTPSLRAAVDEKTSSEILTGIDMPGEAACVPASSNTTLVCDPNHLLSDIDTDKIKSQLAFLKTNSTFRCQDDGVNMGIFIRRFHQTINSAAVDKLRRDLDMGACGVLLYMIFTPSNQAFVYLSWGYGLERVLSGLEVRSMKDGMLPFLRHGLYGEAIHAAILDLTAFFEGISDSTQGYLLSQNLQHLGVTSWVLIFFCSSFVYLPLCLMDLVLGYRAWRRQQRAREQLQKEILEEVEEKLKEIEGNFSPTSNNQHSGNQNIEGEFMSEICIICLEEFPPDNEQFEGITSEETPLFQKGRLGSDGKPVKSLPCGHVFDRTCVAEWMIATRTTRRNAHLTCPVCLEPV